LLQIEITRGWGQGEGDRGTRPYLLEKVNNMIGQRRGIKVT
jgi:hypothetical protein